MVSAAASRAAFSTAAFFAAGFFAEEVRRDLAER
jgi:hypothetical protein